MAVTFNFQPSRENQLAKLREELKLRGEVVQEFAGEERARQAQAARQTNVNRVAGALRNPATARLFEQDPTSVSRLGRLLDDPAAFEEQFSGPAGEISRLQSLTPEGQAAVAASQRQLQQEEEARLLGLDKDRRDLQKTDLEILQTQTNMLQSFAQEQSKEMRGGLDPGTYGPIATRLTTINFANSLLQDLQNDLVEGAGGEFNFNTKKANYWRTRQVALVQALKSYLASPNVEMSKAQLETIQDEFLPRLERSIFVNKFEGNVLGELEGLMDVMADESQRIGTVWPTLQSARPDLFALPRRGNLTGPDRKPPPAGFNTVQP